jgi:hypothetical protein
MRIAPPIVIDESTRRELERLSRKRSMAARVVLRSRIVLLAVEGNQNKQIAEQLGVSTRMAALWRGRFIEHGIEGLLEGRAPAWTHTQDHGRDRRCRRCQNHPKHAGQRHPLVHAHHGSRDGHQRGQCAAHLARPRTEAASC